MTLALIDTSALAKLVVRETSSEQLRAAFAGYDRPTASALVETELRRALVRAGADEPERAAASVVDRLYVVDVDRSILRAAGRLTNPLLRSLDAIHLATALHLGAALDVVVTYDLRMAEAARSLGLEVTAPGSG